MIEQKNRDTTIRVRQDTKRVLENLDFVKKHSFDTIIQELVKHYHETKENALKREKLEVKLK